MIRYLRGLVEEGDETLEQFVREIGAEEWPTRHDARMEPERRGTTWTGTSTDRPFGISWKNRLDVTRRRSCNSPMQDSSIRRFRR